MSTWESNIEAILKKPGDSISRKSQLRSLITIFEAAQDMGISPEAVNTNRLACLETIIKSAKTAIENGDRNHLLDLFSLANTLTVIELRIELDIPKREPIPIHKRFFPETGRTLIYPHFTEGQFENIQQRNKLQYIFVERDNLQ